MSADPLTTTPEMCRTSIRNKSVNVFVLRPLWCLSVIRWDKQSPKEWGDMKAETLLRPDRGWWLPNHLLRSSLTCLWLAEGGISAERLTVLRWHLVVRKNLVTAWRIRNCKINSYHIWLKPADLHRWAITISRYMLHFDTDGNLFVIFVWTLKCNYAVFHQISCEPLSWSARKIVLWVVCRIFMKVSVELVIIFLIWSAMVEKSFSEKLLCKIVCSMLPDR